MILTTDMCKITIKQPTKSVIFSLNSEKQPEKGKEGRPTAYESVSRPAVLHYSRYFFRYWPV